MHFTDINLVYLRSWATAKIVFWNSKLSAKDIQQLDQIEDELENGLINAKNDQTDSQHDQTNDDDDDANASTGTAITRRPQYSYTF